MTRLRPLGGVLLVGAGALLIATAAAIYVFGRPSGAAPVRATWESGAPARFGGAGAGPARSSAPSGLPTRLRIPVIGVDARLETLHLTTGGVLDTPNDYNRAGWYADGTAPGDVGPAVIAGHVDSLRGPAVFFRLAQLRPGDEVLVGRGSGWVTFRVVTVGRYAKKRFPTAEVYGSTPDPQLRLITCGGRFDTVRRSYDDNIVAYAVAA